MEQGERGPDRASLFRNLVLAHRILYRHGVLDAWGHVSARDPHDSSRYFMVRAMPPALVALGDVVQLDLNSDVVGPSPHALYIERFIHGAIYAARSDVGAVLHSHSPSLIPFGVSDVPLRALTQVAGFLGVGVPVFDIRDVDDGADFLISTPRLGGAVAERLGSESVVLLRGHGSVAVGTSLEQVVWRGIYAEINAKQQQDAMKLGAVRYLSAVEAEYAAVHVPPDRHRAWDLWVHEVIVETTDRFEEAIRAHGGARSEPWWLASLPSTERGVAAAKQVSERSP